MKIEAYVVVSDDDNLADHNGNMPDALKNDAEWAFFQDGMDIADVTVLGRRSHEATPNHRQRRRLVMTRSPGRFGSEDKVVYWDPGTTDLKDALLAFGKGMEHLAVVGGQSVFDYFLSGSYRYTQFHLSRVRGVTLPGGVGVFSEVDAGDKSAEDVLRQAGYEPGEKHVFDDGVDAVSWVPAG